MKLTVIMMMIISSRTDPHALFVNEWFHQPQDHNDSNVDDDAEEPSSHSVIFLNLPVSSFCVCSVVWLTVSRLFFPCRHDHVYCPSCYSDWLTGYSFPWQRASIHVDPLSHHILTLMIHINKYIRIPSWIFPNFWPTLQTASRLLEHVLFVRVFKIKSSVFLYSLE